jgi:hypothetical protein
MKTQRQIRQFAVIGPKSWNFQPHPWLPEIIAPRPFVGWGHDNTHWKGIEIVYDFCVMHFPKSEPFEVSTDFSDDRLFMTDLSERGETELKMLPLEFNPSPKGSWAILRFWQTHSRSSVQI